jgi:hypothetical protein
MATDVGKRMSVRSYRPFPAFGGFFEASIGLDDNLRLALRGGYYQSRTKISVSSFPYYIYHSAFPVLIGLETDVSKGQNWDVSGSLYGGAGLLTATTVVATDYSIGNSFTLSGLSYILFLNFSAKYWFSQRLSAVFEFGGYFSQTGKQTIAGDFFGSGPFKISDSEFAQMRARHIGPLLGVGLQFRF